MLQYVDEEDLAATDKRFIQELRKGRDAFVAGRQFLAVAIVVVVALFFRQLEQVGKFANPSADDHPLFDLLELVRRDSDNLYAYLFPVIILLWVAQIIPKFVAQRRPRAFTSSGFARFVIRFSMALGTLRGSGVAHRLLTWVIQSEPNEDQLKPSRAQLYTTLAAFRSGIGIEHAEYDILMDSLDGSVEVHQNIHYQSYSDHCVLIKKRDEWDASIIDTPRIEVLPAPRHSEQFSFTGPKFLDDQRIVEWSIRFAEPLQLEDNFKYSVSYCTMAGAMKCHVGEGDNFKYSVVRPVRRLTVALRLKDSHSNVLTQGDINVDASEDPVVNDRERLRIVRNGGIISRDDGYQYEIRYPLPSAKYRFTFKVETRILAKPVDLD